MMIVMMMMIRSVCPTLPYVLCILALGSRIIVFSANHGAHTLLEVWYSFLETSNCPTTAPLPSTHWWSQRAPKTRNRGHTQPSETFLLSQQRLKVIIRKGSTLLYDSRTVFLSDSFDQFRRFSFFVFLVAQDIAWLVGPLTFSFVSHTVGFMHELLYRYIQACVQVPLPLLCP